MIETTAATDQIQNPLLPEPPKPGAHAAVQQCVPEEAQAEPVPVGR